MALTGNALRAKSIASRDVTPVFQYRSASPSRRIWQGVLHHRLGMLGLSILAVLGIMAVFAPWLALRDPYITDLRARNQPPGLGHILGTDAVGRDVWARLVFGARVSLSVGIVAVGLSSAIAVLLGSVSGYFGGRIDSLIMRFTDMVLCFPTLLLIITAAAVLPPSIYNIMIIIGIFGWPGMCRLVRGQFLSVRTEDFVTAAVASGASRTRVIFRHMFPNVVGPVMVAATLGLANAIISEASLSFLGLGVQEPMPSWGSTLLTAMQLPTLDGMPWRWMPPATAIALAVLSVNFLGDALRDALDPRSQRR